jgi:hypothetical protein
VATKRNLVPNTLQYQTPLQYGPEISLRDLRERLSYDCLWRVETRGKRRQRACGVHLPDLEQPRPPDTPAAVRALTADAFFIGQSPQFAELLNDLAAEPDAAQRDQD